MAIKINAKELEDIKLDELIPYAKNARTHDKDQINQIVKSIKTFGFNDPIAIDENNLIIEGHGRVLAMEKLKQETIPAIRLLGLSKAEQKAYIIAHNRLPQNAGWDEPTLTIEIQDLHSQGFDVDVLGFDAGEIADMLDFDLGDEKESNDNDADNVPEVEQNVYGVELGQIWRLGDHRLMCGDSTSEEAVGKLMDGQKADMVYTDPPYGMSLNVDYDSMFKNDESHKSKGDRFKKVEGDDKYFDPNFIFETFSKTKEIHLWGADYFYDSLPRGGSWSAWDKRIDENMDKVIGNTTEFLWSKTPHRRLTARVLWSGHHGMGKDDEKSRVHPTQKPIALHEWFFENYGNKKNNIVDLFLGSGSALIACEKTNRKCFGMELDPHYCSVIIKRWEEYTNQKAELLND